MNIKPVTKLTPRMLKELAKVPSEEQDYAILFYFTQNEFETLDACKKHWEEVDIIDFGTAMKKVMAAVQPKLDKFNRLNDSLTS